MKRRALAVLAVLALAAGCSAPQRPTPQQPTPNGPSLAGTSWTVTAIKGSPTLKAKTATIAFTATQYSGNTGCNAFSGDLSQTGASLKLGPATVSAMGCLDHLVATQESQLLSALTEIATVATNAPGVDLLDASGRSVLSLAVTATSAPRALIGTTWRLNGIRSHGSVSTAVHGSTLTLTLARSSYSGRSCNSFGGELTRRGNQLTFSAPHTTNGRCPAAVVQQESIVLDTLRTVDNWQITGSELRLSAPDGSGLDFVAQ